MPRSLTLLSALASTTVRFAADQAQAAGLKLTGFLNYRYEWPQTPHLLAEDAQWIPNRSGGYDYVADPGTSGYARTDAKSDTRVQVWLNLVNQFDGKTRFQVTAVAEHLGGRTTSTNTSIYDAYIAARLGPAEIAAGRFLSDSGLGLICGSPFEDGLHVPAGNEWVKAQVYLTKFRQVSSKAERPNSNNGHMTFGIQMAAAPNRLTLIAVDPSTNSRPERILAIKCA